jgi:hypothetical protein
LSASAGKAIRTVPLNFYKALKLLDLEGIMGNLDDGPDQKPLDENELQQEILHLLPSRHFDLIISHSPSGEYTRHFRHEEVGKALINLWCSGKITADELRTFAYGIFTGKTYHHLPSGLVFRHKPYFAFRAYKI